MDIVSALVSDNTVFHLKGWVSRMLLELGTHVMVITINRTYPFIANSDLESN
jgi:hypothetical protein